MTKIDSENIKCINCGHNFQAAVYTTINTETDPELESKYFNNELNKAACPKCKKEYTVDIVLLYNDMPNNTMIWVVPQMLQKEKDKITRDLTDNFKKGAAILSKLNKGNITFDIVFGIDELKESLKAIRAGFPTEKIKAITVNVLENNLEGDAAKQ